MDQVRPTTTLKLLSAIWLHLSIRRQCQLVASLLIMITSGLAELVSLGTIFPFLVMLSDPEQLWQQPLAQRLASIFGLTDQWQLIIPVTFLFASAAVLTAIIRLTNFWLIGRLAALVGSDLSCECYRRTLYQSYSVHSQRNSATVITAISGEISRTVAAFGAILQLITAFIVAVFLLTGLLMLDAPAALTAFSLFGSAYYLFAIMVRKGLLINSQKIATTSSQKLKALQEGLSSIRDVILDSTQPTFVQTYRHSEYPLRQLQAQVAFVGIFPRYALEALGMISIAFFGAFLVLQSGNGTAAIPLLGTLALGAQRLLPSLQQIYSGWTTVQSSSAALEAVLTMLKQPIPTGLSFSHPYTLDSCISMKGVQFHYANNQADVLRGIEFKIYRGERIGVIGSTGSGKSTIIDLLMGLLVPSAGQVLVDGQDLHDPEHPELLPAWRGAIAHVPQSIFLADSSIAANIAFGVPEKNIDMDRVRHAAFQAQINSYIESMPDGYRSFVGERGIRLSGGQRQRIGIARALYKQASVLVLDEATSALDTATEEAVMESVNTLSPSLTIILIAHRLSTIEKCNRVIHLSNGSVVAIGPPKSILATL